MHISLVLCMHIDSRYNYRIRVRKFLSHARHWRTILYKQWANHKIKKLRSIWKSATTKNLKPKGPAAVTFTQQHRINLWVHASSSQKMLWYTKSDIECLKKHCWIGRLSMYVKHKQSFGVAQNNIHTYMVPQNHPWGPLPSIPEICIIAWLLYDTNEYMLNRTSSCRVSSLWRLSLSPLVAW